MIDQEEYAYFKQELQAQEAGRPYIMHSKELAQDFFARLREDFPQASIYHHGIAQYICVDDEGRRGLVQLMEGEIKRLQSEISELNSIIGHAKEDLERGQE